MVAQNYFFKESKAICYFDSFCLLFFKRKKVCKGLLNKIDFSSKKAITLNKLNKKMLLSNIIWYFHILKKKFFSIFTFSFKTQKSDRYIIICFN